jgi:hypothetical protein
MPDELVINEDICVMIQTSSSGKIAALDFRFWLNSKYLEATRVIVPDDPTNVNDFVPLTPQQKDCQSLMRQNEAYLKLEKSADWSSMQEVNNHLQRRITKFQSNMQKI